MIEARSIRISRLDDEGRPIGEPIDAGAGVVTVSALTDFDGKPCEPIACPPMEPISLSFEYTVYDRALMAFLFGDLRLMAGEPAFQWRRLNFMDGVSLGRWQRANRRAARTLVRHRRFRRRSLRTLP